MDTLTHGLSGALVARLWPAAGAAAPDRRARTAVGFLAAVFPDVDVALSFVDPVFYLNHHRAETHSLVLLPLWALLLAGTAWVALGRCHRFASLLPVCAAGLAVHIAGDLITAYGTDYRRARVNLRRDGAVCTWFTDLRYWYQPLPPPFRYGGCRRGDAGAWRPERLPMRLGGLPYP